MAENTRERGREQAGMTREGRRTMEKVLENTVRDTFLQYIYKLKYCKNVGKKFRLVTAMHRNGPLPQVRFSYVVVDSTYMKISIM